MAPRVRASERSDRPTCLYWPAEIANVVLVVAKQMVCVREAYLDDARSNALAGYETTTKPTFAISTDEHLLACRAWYTR
jgi:hypothetical protein